MKKAMNISRRNFNPLLLYEGHKSAISDFLTYCLASDKYLDVIFVCKDKICVQVHKILLFSVSEYLRRIIMQNSVDDIIYISLPDFDSSVVEVLVNFLYEGMTKVSLRELDYLRQLTEYLGIRFTNIEIGQTNDEVDATRENEDVLHVTERIDAAPYTQEKEDENSSASLDDKNSTQPEKYNRSIFNDEQKVILEQEYKRNKFPTKDTLKRLSEELGFSAHVINQWFGRTRYLRKKRGSASNSLKSEEFSAKHKQNIYSESSKKEADDGELQTGSATKETRGRPGEKILSSKAPEKMKVCLPPEIRRIVEQSKERKRGLQNKNSSTCSDTKVQTTECTVSLSSEDVSAKHLQGIDIKNIENQHENDQESRVANQKEEHSKNVTTRGKFQNRNEDIRKRVQLPQEKKIGGTHKDNSVYSEVKVLLSDCTVSLQSLKFSSINNKLNLGNESSEKRPEDGTLQPSPVTDNKRKRGRPRKESLTGQVPGNKKICLPQEIQLFKERKTDSGHNNSSMNSKREEQHDESYEKEGETKSGSATVVKQNRAPPEEKVKNGHLQKGQPEKATKIVKSLQKQKGGVLFKKKSVHIPRKVKPNEVTTTKEVQEQSQRTVDTDADENTSAVFLPEIKTEFRSEMDIDSDVNSTSVDMIPTNISQNITGVNVSSAVPVSTAKEVQRQSPPSVATKPSHVNHHENLSAIFLPEIQSNEFISEMGDVKPDISSLGMIPANISPKIKAIDVRAAGPVTAIKEVQRQSFPPLPVDKKPCINYRENLSAVFLPETQSSEFISEAEGDTDVHSTSVEMIPANILPPVAGVNASTADQVTATNITPRKSCLAVSVGTGSAHMNHTEDLSAVFLPDTRSNEFISETEGDINVNLTSSEIIHTSVSPNTRVNISTGVSDYSAVYAEASDSEMDAVEESVFCDAEASDSELDAVEESTDLLTKNLENSPSLEYVNCGTAETTNKSNDCISISDSDNDDVVFVPNEKKSGNVVSCKTTVQDVNTSGHVNKPVYLSKSQRWALEKLFNETKYPTEEQMKKACECLGISRKTIGRWFSKKRQKEKMRSKKEEKKKPDVNNACKSRYPSLSSSAESTATAEETGNATHITHTMGSLDVLKAMLKDVRTAVQKSQPGNVSSLSKETSSHIMKVVPHIESEMQRKKSKLNDNQPPIEKSVVSQEGVHNKVASTIDKLKSLLATNAKISYIERPEDHHTSGYITKSNKAERVKSCGKNLIPIQKNPQSILPEATNASVSNPILGHSVFLESYTEGSNSVLYAVEESTDLAKKTKNSISSYGTACAGNKNNDSINLCDSDNDNDVVCVSNEDSSQNNESLNTRVAAANEMLKRLLATRGNTPNIKHPEDRSSGYIPESNEAERIKDCENNLIPVRNSPQSILPQATIASVSNPILGHSVFLESYTEGSNSELYAVEESTDLLRNSKNSLSSEHVNYGTACTVNKSNDSINLCDTDNDDDVVCVSNKDSSQNDASLNARVAATNEMLKRLLATRGNTSNIQQPEDHSSVYITENNEAERVKNCGENMIPVQMSSQSISPAATIASVSNPILGHSVFLEAYTEGSNSELYAVEESTDLLAKSKHSLSSEHVNYGTACTVNKSNDSINLCDTDNDDDVVCVSNKDTSQNDASLNARVAATNEMLKRLLATRGNTSNIKQAEGHSSGYIPQNNEAEIVKIYGKNLIPIQKNPQSISPAATNTSVSNPLLGLKDLILQIKEKQNMKK